MGALTAAAGKAAGNPLGALTAAAGKAAGGAGKTVLEVATNTAKTAKKLKRKDVRRRTLRNRK